MTRSTRQQRRTVQFKLDALARMKESENISVLVKELGITSGQLYNWRRRYAEGGTSALRAGGSRDPTSRAKPPHLRDRVKELDLRIPTQSSR